MFVSIYYKPSLFNAHTMILIFHIFMNVNKLCLNQVPKYTCKTHGFLPGNRKLNTLTKPMGWQVVKYTHKTHGVAGSYNFYYTQNTTVSYLVAGNTLTQTHSQQASIFCQLAGGQTHTHIFFFFFYSHQGVLTIHTYTHSLINTVKLYQAVKQTRQVTRWVLSEHCVLNGAVDVSVSVLLTAPTRWTLGFLTDSHTPAPRPHLTLGFHGSAFCTTEGVAGLGGVGGISSSLPVFKPSISRIRSSSRSRPPSKGSSRLLCLTKLFTL